jgi:hypothetical protein
MLMNHRGTETQRKDKCFPVCSVVLCRKVVYFWQGFIRVHPCSSVVEPFGCGSAALCLCASVVNFSCISRFELHRWLSRVGKVERGGLNRPQLSVSRVHFAPHRTGRADFPHPALRVCLVASLQGLFPRWVQPAVTGRGHSP